MITLLEQAIYNLHEINTEELIEDVKECIYHADIDDYYADTIDTYEKLYHQLTSATAMLADMSLKMCYAYKAVEEEYEDYLINKNNNV